MQKVEDRQARVHAISLALRKALVVDQDRKDLQDYAGVLRRIGFEVNALTDYRKACEFLESETPDFVFVNQGSAEFEGREVLQRALARNRHTPVVVLTQSVDIVCYLDAMQLGAVDYVEKPLVPEEMEYLVTTHLRPRTVAMGHSA